MPHRRSLVASCLAAMMAMGLLSGPPIPVAAATAAGAADADVLDRPRRGEDAIARMGARADEAAARNGMTVSELHATLRGDDTYYVDRTGRLVVHDTDLLAGDTVEPAPVASASPAFPYTQTFQLHSRPGARRVIYLDFDGQEVSGTAWNTNYTGGAPFTASAYDTDGLASFSNAEQDVVQSVWQRVAEDYSAFDVDVTTQDPGTAAITRAGTTDDYFGSRALITNTTTIYASCGCGGIAYVGTYDYTPNHEQYQPAFVFQRGVGAGARNIAEAASHEVGHNLGLSHDGTTTADYYAGHGEWAPIMGIGYYEPLTQWSRGEYSGATNTEDDFVVMQANGAPLRADDHGNSADAATALSGSELRVTGQIGSRTDTDWFRFTTGTGQVSLEVAPASTSPNLDASLTIFDAATERAFADPASAEVSVDVASGLGASVVISLPAGTYWARVDGVGKGTPSAGYSDYASIGQYTLTGTVPASTVTNTAPTAAATATPTTGVAPLTVALSSTGSSDPEGPIASRTWRFGDGTADATSDGSHTYTTAGTFTASVTVFDSAGAFSSASVTIVVTAPPAAPTYVNAAKSSRLVTVTWTDPSTTTTTPATGFTVQREKRTKSGSWGSLTTIATTAANVTSVTNSPGTGTFRYWVRANGSGGSSAPTVSNVLTI